MGLRCLGKLVSRVSGEMRFLLFITVHPLALSRLAAFSALAANQFLDPVVNLVSDCSHCIERLPLRVWKRPVNRPQIGNERTGFSATHGHKDGSGSGEVFGQPPRS